MYKENEREETVKHHDMFECLRILGNVIAYGEGKEELSQISHEDWVNCFKRARAIQEGLLDARRFYK